MRKNLNDIVVNELQAEYYEIIEYRKAVASGIESYVDPVLDDIELTNAFDRVISYYKNKTDIPCYDTDIFSYANYDSSNSYLNESDKLDISINGVDFSELIVGDIDFEDTAEHTKEYYDTERNR